MDKKRKGHVIGSVQPGSTGERYGIMPGDVLVTVNGQEIEDIFDYRFLIQEEKLTLGIDNAAGERRLILVQKDCYDDMGIEFENSLMDEYRSCCNQCIFCFIDQMPPNMRETLYFKDDDSRLSFLQGNYVTLTNMSDHDIERIIRYHLAPINISVHTTNPQLRCRMLNNRFAGEALKKIDRLCQAKIQMNSQIVLCPGINDGAELNRTIGDLAEYLPYMESLSVVPVGLTKYRDGLYPLRTFTCEEARETVDLIESWQRKLYEKHGVHFVQASDEFYILAKRPLPEEARYDGYLQLENGVGMLRLMTEEVRAALKESIVEYRSRGFRRFLPPRLQRRSYLDTLQREVSLATGRLAYPFMRKYARWIQRWFPQVTVHVYAIRNDFFGEEITVSGLITGQDLIRQMAGQKLGSALLLPVNMFRSGEEVFLDDVTRSDVEKALQVPVIIVKSSGRDLIRAILGWKEGNGEAKHSPYELS